MNRFQSLRTAAILLVMAVMSIACSLSGFVLLSFKFFGLFKGYIQWTPIVLTLAMLIMSIAIGTVLAFAVSKRFLKPMDDLIEANKRVAAGDFSVRVDEEKSHVGEMYDLLHSFNTMAGELQGIELYRSDFINNFSHEFKTPIISIRGFARQLKNQSLTEEQRQEYLNIIIDESEKLCNMSGNVLQLSKLENQTMVSNKTIFALDEQIRNCILLLERQWSKKQIHFELSLPPLSICNNADMLSQVWTNLISNAIKFVETDGTVGIRGKSADGMVEIQVFDNGCGMSRETAEHIFEKFYQGDTSHAKEGNGLGLSIVKRIVQLCGGTIRVSSKEQLGTTFTVQLPTGIND